MDNLTHSNRSVHAKKIIVHVLFADDEYGIGLVLPDEILIQIDI